MKTRMIFVMLALLVITSIVLAQSEPNTFDSYAEALSALQRGIFYTPQDLSNVGEKPVNGKDLIALPLEGEWIALIDSYKGKKFVPLAEGTVIRYEVFFEGQKPKAYALDTCGNKIYYMSRVVARGPRGFTGAQGEKGRDGEQGIPGPKGDPGRDGRDGRDAQVEKSHTGLIIGVVGAIAIVGIVAIASNRGGDNNNNNSPTTASAPPATPVVPIVPPSGDPGEAH